MTRLYAGQDVAFLTRHGKAALISPILEPGTGCRIIHTDAYDTDQLGAFAGDVPRMGSQLEAAREKARIGMALTGTVIGVASEGAFVPDPYGGLMPWNVEILVWRDERHKLEVTGMAQGPARNVHGLARWLPELERLAIEAGFPEHQLMLRPQSEADPRIHKGIADWGTLKTVFKQCQRQANNQLAVVESDLRAFCNPTRQAMIRQAAVDLLKKLQSTCPQCALPGFSITGHQAGLPCRLCGQPTRLAKSLTWHCDVCQHSQVQMSDQLFADPGRCDCCNP